MTFPTGSKDDELHNLLQHLLQRFPDLLPLGDGPLPLAGGEAEGERSPHPEWERHLGAVDPGEDRHSLSYAAKREAELEKTLPRSPPIG